MAGLSIKDAPLVVGVKEEIKMPVSDGTNSAKTISIGQIKNFILKLFGRVAVSNDYNDLDNKPAIPNAITEADIKDMGFTKNKGDYVKPLNGIPKIDLDEDVQSSLNKADSALQEHQDISHLATKDEVNDGLALKQDAIEDLEQIRKNASKGATAIQDIPAEYITKTELHEKDYATNKKLNNKVDKVEGKQLSTEDFTTLLKEKLEGLNNYNDAEVRYLITKLRSDFDTLLNGDTSTAIDTFNNIVAFLEGIEDTQSLKSILTAIELQIAAKQDKITDLDAIRSGAAKGATALQSYNEQYKGTVTGIKINGTTKNPSNGIVDLGTVIIDISGKADKSVVGAFYKGNWTASEAVGISKKLTETLVLPAGVYVVNMVCPYCSDLAMEICVNFSASMAIGSGATFIKACYGTITMLAKFEGTTNLHVLTAASNTNAKWSYLDRGGIAAIRIA